MDQLLTLVELAVLTSGVAEGVRSIGPLLGGFDAWQRTGYATEPKRVAEHRLRDVAANLCAAEGDDEENPESR